MSKFRIQFYFGRHIRRMGSDLELRQKQTMRNVFTSQVNGHFALCEKKAKRVFE
jgi:hypothetical protein